MTLYIQKPKRTTVNYLQSGRNNTETLPDTTGTHTDRLTNKRGCLDEAAQRQKHPQPGWGQIQAALLTST